MATTARFSSGSGFSSHLAEPLRSRTVHRMVEDLNNERPITIRDLYPHMTDEELAVAEANLKRYVAVLVRIHDRLKAEGKSWPGPGDLQ